MLPKFALAFKYLVCDALVYQLTSFTMYFSITEKTIEPIQVEFLLRGGQSMDTATITLTPSASSSGTAAPMSSGLPDWMDSTVWAKINALAELEGFGQLPTDISAASKRFLMTVLICRAALCVFINFLCLQLPKGGKNGTVLRSPSKKNYLRTTKTCRISRSC